MRWRGRRESSNVEDRRGMVVRRPVVAGGGGLILVVALLLMLCGRDPSRLLEMLDEGSFPPSADVGGDDRFPSGASGPGFRDEQARFVSVVLADTEDTWSRLFASNGSTYRPPTLVLFTDMVESACGYGSAAVGPFYCPGDEQVYIDLGFFHELSARFGAPGDFAQAYVLAHEIGHHVQNLLGLSDRVRAARSRAREEREINALSVAMELQADCLAGVWGHHAAAGRELLEEGDIEEGLRAAAAIGDDRIQRMATGRVSPESWTHGSSEQRARWFRKGLQGGSLAACDTSGAGR
jgi:uncharacterized protein